MLITIIIKIDSLPTCFQPFIKRHSALRISYQAYPNKHTNMHLQTFSWIAPTCSLTAWNKQFILQTTPFISLTVWLISVQHAGDLWWSNETTPACCPSLCSVSGEEQCNVRLESTRQLQVGLTLWQWRSVYFHFLLAISKIVVKLSKNAFSITPRSNFLHINWSLIDTLRSNSPTSRKWFFDTIFKCLYFVIKWHNQFHSQWHN